MASELEYFQSLPDYEDLAPFIDENDVLEYNFPQFVPDFSSALVVDGLPIIPFEKKDKLCNVLYKLYVKVCSTLVMEDINMPFDSANNSYGFCFIKLSTKELVDAAITHTNGFKLDAKHSLKVNSYTDLDKYATLTEECVYPEAPAFKPRPDPTSWLSDTQCRDQFVIRYSSETEIHWSTTLPTEVPSIEYGGEREKEGGKVWCERMVSWSPLGTYLATFHAPGIKIWGSHKFESQGRFLHTNAELLEFSPCENYLVTYTFDHPQNPAKAMIVWSVRNGQELRGFELKNPLDAKFHVTATLLEELKGKKGEVTKKVERVARCRVVSYEKGYFTLVEGSTTHEKISADKVAAMQNPNILKWSGDGRYLARQGTDAIQVYELPHMGLLDKKSVAAPGVIDFCWSPRGSLMAYWSPAAGNLPAQVNIISLPDRKDVSTRRMFDVLDGIMVWQNDGDYLCVYMTKQNGKKPKTYLLFLFRIRESGVPVENLELTDPIIHLSFEPSGERLVIVQGEAKNSVVTFYSLTNVAKGKGVKELTVLSTLKDIQCSEVIWSPAGGVAAIVFFQSDNCWFNLFDVDSVSSLASRRQERCSRLVWDPSGRTFAAFYTTPLRQAHVRGQPEDGYTLYSFQGQHICTVKKDKLFRFAWRPRPMNVMSPEERTKVIKNLKKYEKVFDKEDHKKKNELKAERDAQKREISTRFLTVLTQRRAENALLRARRVVMKGGYDSEDDANYDIIKQVEETVLSTKEHFMQKE